MPPYTQINIVVNALISNYLMIEQHWCAMRKVFSFAHDAIQFIANGQIHLIHNIFSALRILIKTSASDIAQSGLRQFIAAMPFRGIMLGIRMTANNGGVPD
jgi:hypothetical protein